jgi:hypothetical protein
MGYRLAASMTDPDGTPPPPGRRRLPAARRHGQRRRHAVLVRPEAGVRFGLLVLVLLVPRAVRIAPLFDAALGETLLLATWVAAWTGGGPRLPTG